MRLKDSLCRKVSYLLHLPGISTATADWISPWRGEVRRAILAPPLLERRRPAHLGLLHPFHPVTPGVTVEQVSTGDRTIARCDELAPAPATLATLCSSSRVSETV